jgi:hypothetical protein
MGVYSTLICGAICLHCQDLKVVEGNQLSGFRPNQKKILPFGFSSSAEADRIFAFYVLAKTGPQMFNLHDLKVVAI